MEKGRTMKRVLTILCAAAMCLAVTSCAPKEEPGADAPEDISSSTQGLDRTEDEKSSDTDKKDFSQYEIDPPYDFDPASMLPREFGDYFTTDYKDCKVDTYKLAEGTDIENEVTVLTGSEEGPTIYVVAGVHGDEQAAWLTGDLLEKISIKAGTLYILSPANRWGAAQPVPTRYVTEEQDLNRSFPGDPDGDMAHRIADSIYRDIERIKPDFVFDLHEARIVKSGRDFLGSSLIFTSLDGMSEMFMSMIMETEMGTLCSEPFQYFSPGPAGSVNQTVTKQLGIPTVTVETFRGYPMEQRIGDQLAIVQYVMNYYGLVD